MIGGQIEGGGDGGLGRTLAHQPRFGAHAERQSQGVEQDRLAGAGLAGQHREMWRQVEIEPLDQHDITNRQAEQHRHAGKVNGYPDHTGLRAGYEVPV